MDQKLRLNSVSENSTRKQTDVHHPGRSKRLQLASILYLLHYGYAALQPFVNYIDEVFHDVVFG